MKRRRGIETFSLSMLDVISGALAAFLIIVIILLPYYKKDAKDYQTRIRELEAETEKAKAETAATRSEVATLRMADLDLVLVMDTTGSMGEEIEELKANLDSLVRLLRALTASLQVGFVAYRDIGDEYVTRAFPLVAMDEKGYRQLHAFIRDLVADGGGDDPEAVDAALKEAVDNAWRNGAHGYIIVVGDAPAHASDYSQVFELAETYAGRSAHNRVSAISVGGGAGFFQRLAEYGNGSYISNRGELYESLLVSVLKKD